MYSEKYIKLGKILGIPFGLDYSFIIVALLLLFTGSSLWVAIYFILAASVVVHEYGHVLMARRYGLGCESVRIGFFGGVALLYFEAARTLQPKRNGKEEILISLAGPLTSALLLLIGLAITSVGYTNTYLQYFIGINIFVTVVNLVPVFPLDGGRILRGALTYFLDYPKATVISKWVARFILVAALAVFLNLGYYFYIILVAYVTLLSEQTAWVNIIQYEQALKNKKEEEV